MHKYYLLHHIENDSWDLNGHFNSNGYLVLANVIFEELQKKKELKYLFN
jgi:hypothetical protein